MARVFVAIGSNVGDRQAYLDQARRQLAKLPDTRLVRFSDAIETEPVGPVAQGLFLNAAAELQTTLLPQQLLKHLQAMERLAGRPPRSERTRWGPRTLDLDVLLYDDQVIDQPDLIVPHPQMHLRRFVLEPLARIAGDVVHPTLDKTIDQLLAQLPG